MAENDPKPADAPVTPEAEATSRINGLIAQVKLLEQEIRTLEGRLKNRDPKAARRLQAENAVLKSRLVVLEKALFLLLSDANLPRNLPEFNTQLQYLTESSIEFFKQSNIDPELWKNIGS